MAGASVITAPFGMVMFPFRTNVPPRLTGPFIAILVPAPNCIVEPGGTRIVTGGGREITPLNVIPLLALNVALNGTGIVRGFLGASASNELTPTAKMTIAAGIKNAFPLMAFLIAQCHLANKPRA
jgi:hypothetical protein